MGVDIVNILRSAPRVIQGHAHAPYRTVTILRRRRHVIPVPGKTEAYDLGKYPSSAPLRVFKLFQDQHAATLGDDKTVPVSVKRPACLFRVFILPGKGFHGVKTANSKRTDG